MNAIPNQPITCYSLQATYVNGGCLRPKVGVKFSDAERNALINWLRSFGCEAKPAGTVIKFYTPSGLRADELPDGFDLARKAKARAKREAESKRRSAVESEREARFNSSQSAKWIVATFGQEFINTYNKAALADYLDGRAKEFDGMLSHKWVDGLLAIGFAESDLGGALTRNQIAERIKRAWLDSCD